MSFLLAAATFLAVAAWLRLALFAFSPHYAAEAAKIIRERTLREAIDACSDQTRDSVHDPSAR